MPPTPKIRGAWWKTRWFIGAACLVVGVAMGQAGSKGGGTTTATPTATSTVTATITEQPEAAAPAPTATETVVTTVTAEPPAPSAAFEDGMFEVGKDIQPGTYQASGNLCYWARLNNASGELDSIIANGNGPTIVTIKASDKYFQSQNCGGWKAK
jgi:hypothetical protein